MGIIIIDIYSLQRLFNVVDINQRFIQEINEENHSMILVNLRNIRTF